MDNISKYVLLVNELMSLTKASKKLGISQPALSSALNNLEKKLGYQIFDRRKSPLSLTKEGAAYVEYINECQVLENNLNRKISDIRNCEESSLTIGAPGTYIDSILTPAVARFCRERPSCKIKIVESTVPELVSKAKEGKVDFFISTSGNLSKEFALEKITTESICLCIPVSYKLNSKLEKYRIDYHKGILSHKTLTKNARENSNECFLPIKLLENQRFVFLEENQPMQIEIEKYLKLNDCFPRSFIEADQVKTALSLSLLGCGICFASSSVLDCCHELDKLCIYPLDDEFFARDIYAAYSTTNYVSDNSKHFIEILKENEVTK